MRIFRISAIAFLLSAIVSAAGGYDMPTGIPDPAPNWGGNVDPIESAAPARPVDWSSEVPGYYFISYATGTDSGRTYGTPTAPRRTIPRPVPAGSRVEISGAYSYAQSGTVWVQASGTSAAWSANSAGPVWFVSDPSAQGVIDSSGGSNTLIYGSYIIFDGVNFFRRAKVGSGTAGRPADYVCIRNADVDGDNYGSILLSASGSSSDPVSNVVVYNNSIHNAGDIDATFDQDSHGISVGLHTYYVWLLNNTVNSTSGSGVQFGGQGGTDQTTCRYLYCGGNTFRNTRQSGVAIKSCKDLVVSSNDISAVKNTEWSESKGIGLQYRPDGVWLIFNRIRSGARQMRWGIRNGSDDSGTWHVYVIGNLIYDIQANQPYVPDSYKEAGISVWASKFHIVGNTIYDVPTGIMSPSNTDIHVENNIISERNESTGWEIYFANTTAKILRNNIFYTSGSYSFKWGSTEYSSTAAFESGSGASGSAASDPLFVDTASYADLSIQSGSPARDAGLADTALTVDVYDLFETTFGLSIRRDFAGNNRPDATVWDMGAYEYGATGGTTPPTAPSGLSANAVTSSRINLAWTDNSSDETVFKIERSLDGSSWSEIDTVSANVTAYSDIGLSPETQYWYRVRANNAAGNSGYTALANDTTDAAPAQFSGRGRRFPQRGFGGPGVWR